MLKQSYFYIDLIILPNYLNHYSVLKQHLNADRYLFLDWHTDLCINLFPLSIFHLVLFGAITIKFSILTIHLYVQFIILKWLFSLWMLRNYFGKHFCSFLFLQAAIKVICFLIQDLNFVFEVREVFKINLMNHSQLIVYQHKLIKNHLIKLILVYCEVRDNLLEDHELGLRLL